MAHPRGPIEELRLQRHESRTSQTYSDFLKDLRKIGVYRSLEEAEQVAVAVLRTLEQRLPNDEAEDLSAQLPERFHSLFLDVRSQRGDWKPEKLHREEFLDRVAAALGSTREQAETAVRNVFLVVRSLISEGEASDVAAQLPADLKPLWVQPA